MASCPGTLTAAAAAEADALGDVASSLREYLNPLLRCIGVDSASTATNEEPLCSCRTRITCSKYTTFA